QGVVIQGIAGAVRRHPLAATLLSRTQGVNERVARWTDAATGVQCKGRLDRVCKVYVGDAGETDLMVVDLKTAADASQHGFQRALAGGYWRQAVHYQAGVRAVVGREPRFIFVVCETAPPFAVGVWEMSAAEQQAAEQRYRRELEAFARCLRDDDWPGYTPDLEPGTITLPLWWHRQEQGD
ncbi:MAG: PD-(D/E)XK nuclease-like domain-containing protein, partial [Verrucomicrobiota bacterium]